MKNYVQPGENITLTALADVASGEFVTIGAIRGVAQGSALAGEPVTLVRRGVFTLPKTSAQAWTEGAAVYWDDSAEAATTVDTDNTLIGAAAAAAANPSAEGDVLLDGVIR